MHPLYKWLTSKDLNGVPESDVYWNFQKYLIDGNGSLVKMISPKQCILEQSVYDWIENVNK